jgi:hypothetical protein
VRESVLSGDRDLSVEEFVSIRALSLLARALKLFFIDPAPQFFIRSAASFLLYPPVNSSTRQPHSSLELTGGY